MQKKHRIICLHFFLLLSLLSVSAGAAEKKTAYKTINYPGMQTQEVKSLKEKYLSKNYRAWLYRILDEGQQYRIFVRNELAKNNMPAILEYLPLVESDYNPNAMSASGAAGLWQFMTNSVAGLLEYNEYVDQRLDPWVSTEAAIKKLKENYRTFGDWLLAITAYNCGAGALNRAIKKAGKPPPHAAFRPLLAPGCKEYSSVPVKYILSTHAGTYCPETPASRHPHALSFWQAPQEKRLSFPLQACWEVSRYLHKNSAHSHPD